jgi:hypothetical protein
MPPLALIVLALLPSPAAGYDQSRTVDEYELKAAYLYNMAKFVDWPDQTFSTPLQPIVFCVLGRTPLSDALREAISGKVVNSRPLVFRQLTDSKQAGPCQVLFISSQDIKELRRILGEVKSSSVLTVGEVAEFTSQGGIVRLVSDAGRVRLEFNLNAADDAKLHVSSKLLSLGTTVRIP